jgi:hypothetical protein
MRTPQQELADRLSAARSVQDIDDILVLAEAIYGPLDIRPVGGRPNNIGTVRVASDPGQASVERITNGMDAILELLARLRGASAPSPRAASRAWLGTDASGLAAMTETARRSIAESLTVVVDESGEERRPTLIVDDRGIGQHPDDFPGTLLSLNESNKVDKPYTMGAFGQGGSATFGFSRATIILSRRHPSCLDGKLDRVGWTIVREFFDPTTMKLPNYSYYAPAGASGVFDLDPALLPDFPHGARITHIAYDLQGAATVYTTGIWQLYNAALFDPVMPFIVGGVGRYSPEKGGAKPATRVITGNATRLAGIEKARGDIDLAHSESVELELGAEHGSVQINYWVLTRPEGSTSKSDITAGYVKADSAIVMTLFGQRQDQLPRTWLKDHAKLPYLFKNMIVQIDADGLTPIAKRELFASTRERATESDLRRTIYDFLETQLKGDEELARLNHLEKVRLMNRSTAATNDKIRQRLAKFIKTRLKEGIKTGSGPGTTKGTGKAEKPHRPTKKVGAIRPPRKTDDSRLPKVPTYIRFEKEHVRLVQGSESAFWVEIDAKNGYPDENKDALEIIWPHGGKDKIKVKSKSRLKGGKSRWYVACAPDTAVGEYKLRAEFFTPNGLLEDTLVVRVVEPPTTPSKTTKTGGEGDPGVDVRWVAKADWEEHGFTAKSVGRVDIDDESTTIWVNRNYVLLDQALSGSTLTAEQVTQRSERYQFPVACALWLQDHDLKKLADAERPGDAFIASEQERLAEAVLTAMNADIETAPNED